MVELGVSIVDDDTMPLVDEFCMEVGFSVDAMDVSVLTIVADRTSVAF